MEYNLMIVVGIFNGVCVVVYLSISMENLVQCMLITMVVIFNDLCVVVFYEYFSGQSYSMYFNNNGSYI